tara:strand:- start:183 stop:566 length:384 start_codon:yes stop_codon:yes gene_type:complete
MVKFQQGLDFLKIDNLILKSLTRWYKEEDQNKRPHIFDEDLVELVLLSIEYKKNYGKDVLPKLIRERDLNELGRTIRREGTFLTIKDSEELREGLIVYRRESRVMFRERKYLIIMENGETILIQEKV